MKIKIRKKYLFYVLAFSSAIISALNSGIDASVTKLYITDPWALGLSIFIVGVPITILFALFFSIKIKKKSIGSRIADPSFEKIRLIRKEELKPQILAGFGNAVYTIGYFALFALIFDPSVVLPFTQAVILYLVLVESVNEKETPTLSEIQSILIVTFGAILGSISLSGDLNLNALAIVFLVINPAWVILTIYQRKLKRMKINDKTNDSINIRFWNVIFACFFTIVLVSLYDIVFRTNHLIAGFRATIDNFHWVSIIAIAAFFSFVFYIRALGIGKASIAQAVRSSIIIFSIPVSLFIAYLGIIEPFSFDPVMLLIKTIGVIIMVLGIASFALNLVKAYIFIKIKTGYDLEETMQKIWKIKGVTRVSIVAGEYDFIVKIRTRALVKGYEKILRKIEQIESIKSFKWESVLKEWEDI